MHPEVTARFDLIRLGATIVLDDEGRDCLRGLTHQESVLAIKFLARRLQGKLHRRDFGMLQYHLNRIEGIPFDSLLRLDAANLVLSGQPDNRQGEPEAQPAADQGRNDEPFLFVFRQRDRWAVHTVGFNLILLAFTWWTSADLRGAPGYCYTIALIAVVVGLSSILGLFRQHIGATKTLVVMLGHAAAMIFIFALIYEGFGLLKGGSPLAEPTWPTAVYFSIVTWTTLGYGDFTPAPQIALVAAGQAIAGYVFFGIFVGLLAAIVGRPVTQEQLP